MTQNIETVSSSKIWVLACGSSESCEIESLDNDVSFIESETIPTTQIEDNNMVFKKLIPRNFIGDNISSLWVFIDNKTRIRKRHLITPDIQVESSDFAGNESMNSIVGETITAERTDNVNVMFEYNIGTYDTIQETIGDASLTHSDAKAQLNIGNGVGLQYLRSKEVVRYVTGHEVNVEFTAIFDNPQINTFQRIGIGNTQDTTDGVIAPSYQNLDFGISLQTIEDGLIHIKQSDFNKDKLDGTGLSGHTLNQQAENLYKITFGWYGILPIKVSVFCGETKGFVLAHVYDRANETLTPHLPNPTNPITACISRLTGTGTPMQLQTSSWRGGIVGKIGASSLIDRIFMIKTKKTINGVNIPVISIRNKTTFQGRENNVKIRLGTFTPISDGSKSVEFDVYKSGVLTGGVWVSQDPDNSVSEYNNTATSFVPDSDIIGGTGLAKVDRDRINLVKGDVILNIYPGEEVHIVSSSSSSNDVILYLRRIEEF